MIIWDIVVTVLLAACVFLAVRKIIYDKRRGKSCCGDCSSCGCGCGGSANGSTSRNRDTAR